MLGPENDNFYCCLHSFVRVFFIWKNIFMGIVTASNCSLYNLKPFVSFCACDTLYTDFINLLNSKFGILYYFKENFGSH